MTDLSQHTKLIELFPCPVQLSKHPDHARLNAGLLTAIRQIQTSTPNSRPEDWACAVYTTIENANELQMAPEFAELSQFIAGELIEFAKQTGVFLPESNVYIRNMWLNIYEKNCSTDVHVHPNSLFSGLYIVQAPPGSAKEVFDSPAAEKMISVPVLEDNDFNLENVAYEPEEGQLIIFNSNLRHRALLHTLNEDRITIEFTAVI